MNDRGEPAPARPEKRATAFRTIGEAADDLDLPAHVLRFWESKFSQLKPLKRSGGRRYYRPEDIELLRRIRQCLYQDGYTIRGAQKLFGGPPGEAAAATRGPDMATLFPLDTASEASSDPRPSPPRPRRRPATPGPLDPDTRAMLEEIRRELQAARAQLDGLLLRLKPP